MSSSSLVGLVIGICFIAVSFLIHVAPIRGKWLFTIYTKEQRAEAIRYISRLSLLFGGLFCIVALLPLLIELRGLRAESFVVLAILTLGLMGRFTKKHISQNTVKDHFQIALKKK